MFPLWLYLVAEESKATRTLCEPEVQFTLLEQTGKGQGGEMTSRQADKIIRKGKPVQVHSQEYEETFTALFVNRTRWSITTSDGGIFDRGDLVIEETDKGEK